MMKMEKEASQLGSAVLAESGRLNALLRSERSST